MSSLLWKEWHEQRWKVAFGCLIVAAFALIGLRARAVADEQLLQWVCGGAMVLLPVLSTMGLLPAERSEGTLELLLALPVARWRILAVKTLLGAAQCALPFIAAAIVSLVVAGGRELSIGDMSLLFARSIAVAISFFAWMFALTVRLPTEGRAGLLSVGVLVIWLILTFASRAKGVGVFPWVISPLAFTLGRENLHNDAKYLPIVIPIAVQSVAAVALWLLAARQLSKEGQR